MGNSGCLLLYYSSQFDCILLNLHISLLGSYIDRCAVGNFVLSIWPNWHPAISLKLYSRLINSWYSLNNCSLWANPILRLFFNCIVQVAILNGIYIGILLYNWHDICVLALCFECMNKLLTSIMDTTLKTQICLLYLLHIIDETSVMRM